MDVVLVPLFGFLGVAITSWAGWRIARRKTGGTVATSEASEIWTANRELREMLMKEAATRTAENTELRREADARRIENDQLRRENTEMSQRIAELEAITVFLKRRVSELTGS